jgi:hypothetical protein
MEARHEAEIASYASSINRAKESVLQQMSTRRRTAATRQPNAWNMQLSLFAGMCRRNGMHLSHEELTKAVQAAREARNSHSKAVGEGDCEAGCNSDDGDGSDVLFKNDEDIRAAFEHIEQQHADEGRQDGDVALIMKRVVKQLSQQVHGASSRLASPTEYL